MILKVECTNCHNSIIVADGKNEVDKYVGFGTYRNLNNDSFGNYSKIFRGK